MANVNLSLIGVIALAALLFFAAMSVLVFPIQPQLVSSRGGLGTPTVNVTLYAGEFSATKYGFGLSPNNITSPGPTLRFKTSDIVNLTLVNAGQVPHAFAMTNAPRTGASVLFNAQVASSSNPLSPGQSRSTTFAPNSPSSLYYYICPVPGHSELGMYGSCVVTVG
jgi:FtsP/CotA-like multicopper oxidase with cupredoxin domain